MTDGFEVFVQLVIAAITTEPWLSSTFWPSSRTLTRLAEASTGGDVEAVGSESFTGVRAPGAADFGGSLAGKLAASSPSCLP